MGVRVRFREVVLLGSGRGGPANWSTAQTCGGELVLPRSGVSVLTPIGTGVTEIARLVHERVESVCNYRMEMDQCCPPLALGWPVWAGPTGRGELGTAMSK